MTLVNGFNADLTISGSKNGFFPFGLRVAFDRVGDPVVVHEIRLLPRPRCEPGYVRVECILSKRERIPAELPSTGGQVT
jgi:hypothetical protein